MEVRNYNLSIPVKKTIKMKIGNIYIVNSIYSYEIIYNNILDNEVVCRKYIHNQLYEYPLDAHILDIYT